MYIPKLYRLDHDEAVKIMKSYPFAIVVTVDGHTPIATHIPIEIREEDGKTYALGHIAYGNMQKNTLENNPNVLLIFQGPHTYISSSWYEAENVPTWDYLAVHAYGKSRIISGDELESHLATLLQHYESNRENGRLWETLTPGFLQNQIKGIVAFEIEITSIQASGKMSQNRNDRDYKAIVTELEKLNEEDARRVAEWMRNHRPHLF
ncbi:protease synthase and sporulation protein PAI 2 [Alicyclobacillus hesperidum]|uniref:Protease synthase and sporulation protein PAI 2 n=1 Tax=Alicyclobacillus hesperidum TaxID=89784 RepID=A0AA37U4U1_9BACL|nr:FMN-binding negative transcriptional regulator [Alicyclobacillus hesperidum]GLV14715.1 protease synthase and sporulation protein PAI 2 [Alicyclobacillus hesperidum]